MPAIDALRAEYLRAMNKLARWRSVFAAWQLGTRLDTDGECKAVKDHREVTMCMRVELNALTGLLIKKGVFTEEQWVQALIREARDLDKDYEEKFPGYRTTENGVSMSISEAQRTQQRLGFPL